MSAGRSLNDLLHEAQMEPWQDAADDVAEATRATKEVDWEVVRNIANVMTNQLYLGDGVDIEQAHMATNSIGGRDWTLEPGRTGTFRPSWGGDGWWAFDEEDVCRLELTSATSGSGIEATKKSPGVWTIRFIQSSRDPTYRGGYFGLFAEAEGVKNIDPEYVRGNR